MNLDRAMVESAIRAVLAMVVGAGVMRLSAEDQAVIVAGLAPLAWLVVSLWWSRKSDAAVVKSKEPSQ